MLLLGQPCNNFGQESNSPRFFSFTAAILFFFFSFLFLLSAPFVIPDMHWLWQQCQWWYLMIPLAGTNYYQWLRRETWLLTHILSFAWGKLLNYPCQINDEQRCMDPGCIMGSQCWVAKSEYNTSGSLALRAHRWCRLLTTSACCWSVH